MLRRTCMRINQGGGMTICTALYVDALFQHASDLTADSGLAAEIQPAHVAGCAFLLG